MAEALSIKRVAYSPGEFAELFGKSQTWGYRQIYSGKVNAITEHGRILIPAKEVERILETAGIYNGKEKPKQAKAKIEKLTHEQKGIWERFIKLRRQTQLPAENSVEKETSKANARKSILSRVAKSWDKKQQ